MTSHIGLITYALDRALGGIGRYTEELLSGLHTQDIHPLLLASGGGVPTSQSVHMPGTGLLPSLMTLGQIEVAWLAEQHGLELVHDPIGVAPLLLTRARRVSTIHDVIPYVCAAASSSLDWLIYRFWLPYAVRKLDAIITVSQQSRADIVEHLSVPQERITVIPNAASPSYRPLDAGEVQSRLERWDLDFPYILYVGSLTARKNLSRLLEAYAALHTTSTRWELVIVGARKWKSSSIYETVQQLGLEDHIHFTGFVREEDLPILYNGADLLVFPSLYEGFGLPVLEAMACGTPVVTANTSSLPEVAGDAAILIDPYDVQAITEAMGRVVEDRVLAQDLRARGLARAAQFSWERTARETIAVYEKVLGQET